MNSTLLVITVICLGMTALNSVLVLVIWSRHETLRDRAETLSTRLVTLESKLSDLGEIKSKLAEQASMLAALDERSESTQEMVTSIQRFLVRPPA
jgi:flagellar capping protein FliD